MAGRGFFKTRKIPSPNEEDDSANRQALQTAAAVSSNVPPVEASSSTAVSQHVRAPSSDKPRLPLGRGSILMVRRPSESQEPEPIRKRTEQTPPPRHLSDVERPPQIPSGSHEARSTSTQEAGPARTMSRGRGILIGRRPSLRSSVSEDTDTQARLPVPPQPQQQPQLSTQIQEKVQKSVEISQLISRTEKLSVADNEKTKTVEEESVFTSEIKSLIKEKDSDVTSKKSSGSRVTSQDSKSTSQPATTTITSLTSKSIEKATEEISVEHILRQSPVKKTGDSGQHDNFMSNYVKLKCNHKGVYQYMVLFDPPIDSVNHRVRLMKSLNQVTGNIRLFDGVTLFLPLMLSSQSSTYNVRRETDDVEIRVTITLTKVLPPEQIPQNVFNIIFKSIMRELKMVRIGQHYFSSTRQIDVAKHGLQIWPGYTTAVHEFEDGLYLVVDVAHKVLRSQTCWHVMNDIYGRSGADNPNFRQEVINSIVGNIVLTRYNNKTYRIDDIIWEENPRTKFFCRNEEISYVEYYKRQYSIDIKDLAQPLLVHHPKKSKDKTGQQDPSGENSRTVCLIPELCFLTGLNEQIRNDTMIKRDLASFARLSPESRVQQLRSLIEAIRSNKEAYKHITNWGMELEPDLSIVEGRVVQREKIIFSQKQVDVDARMDWSRACGNEKVLRAVEIINWLCVYPANKEKIVENFVMIAMDAAKRIGIRINMPVTVPLPDDRPETYYNYIKENLNQYTQIVVSFFSMISDNRYMKVKKLCCIENPVPSQVVVLKTINKPDNVLKTIAQKIVLQMNVKLGGELWRLVIPTKRIMIVGIDVYHQSEKKYKSLAGFVSSLNEEQTRWYSKVCFQMTGQELVDTLKLAFVQALQKYQEVNNYMPDKIFIYRDGVSEGQIATVVKHEVAQLRTCFSSEYNPSMAFIIVQKRIGTRVFTAGGIPANAPPGTIIDHTITSPSQYDFYLVSQLVNQGTVSPTHFIVVDDNTQMKPDHVQRLSYKLTHMYYNWSGTIRVPAPCQYAHKLAFLIGQYIQDEPDNSLCNRLFYL